MLIGIFSDQIRPETDELTNFLIRASGKDRARVGYIPSSPDPERRYYHDKLEYYRSFGATMSRYVDLEEGFEEDKLDEVFSSDILHLSGGDTLHFQSWLKRRNLFSRLREFANNGGTIIGVSAGGIILTPTVETTLICENRDNSEYTDFEGLGLVPALFDPHSDSREGRDECCLRYSLKYSLPLYSVTDSQCLLFDGKSVRVYGDPVIYSGGQPVAGGDATR